MNRLTKFVNTVFGAIFGVPVEVEKGIFSTILDWSAAAAAEFVLIVMRRIESDFAPLLKDVVKRAEDTGKVPPEVQPLLDEIKDPKAPIAAMLGSAVGGTATGSIVGSTLGPFLLLLQYEIQRIANQARWDPATGLAVVYRRPDKEGLVQSDLRDQGWTDERISLLKDVARTRLVEDLCVDMRRRGAYDETVYLESMRWLGYEAKEAKDYYAAKEVYPSASDLVRMAVKEVFTPEVVQKYGQDQDFPPKFAELAAKIGMSPDFAKWYWAAHWDLPSPQMGFEMLHRGIITQDDLKVLLRALDIMPYWRDKLIQAAYAPFTRVDIRRMHKVGVLTEAQVKQSYMDIGYSAEKAQALTEFTIKLNEGAGGSAEKDLAKSEMVAAYKKGLVPESELRTWLLEAGYDEDEVTLLVDSATSSVAVSTKDLTQSQVKALYQKGLRTRDEVTTWLKTYKYTDAKISDLLNLWDWTKPAATRDPARTDLDLFYKNGIIPEATWRAQMSALGYDGTAAAWYWSELLTELEGVGPGPEAAKVRDLTLAQLKSLYTLGLRTRTQITPFLTALGFNAAGITAIYDLWDWEKPVSDRIPSRTDFDAFIAAGIIDVNAWSDGYTLLGYDMTYQEMYFALLVEKGKIEG